MKAQVVIVLYNANQNTVQPDVYTVHMVDFISIHTTLTMASDTRFPFSVHSKVGMVKHRTF